MSTGDTEACFRRIVGNAPSTADDFTHFLDSPEKKKPKFESKSHPLKWMLLGSLITLIGLAFVAWVVIGATPSLFEIKYIRDISSSMMVKTNIQSPKHDSSYEAAAPSQCRRTDTIIKSSLNDDSNDAVIMEEGSYGYANVDIINVHGASLTEEENKTLNEKNRTNGDENDCSVPTTGLNSSITNGTSTKTLNSKERKDADTLDGSNVTLPLLLLVESTNETISEKILNVSNNVVGTSDKNHEKVNVDTNVYGASKTNEQQSKPLDEKNRLKTDEDDCSVPTTGFNSSITNGTSIDTLNYNGTHDNLDTLDGSNQSLHLSFERNNAETLNGSNAVSIKEDLDEQINKDGYFDQVFDEMEPGKALDVLNWIKTEKDEYCTVPISNITIGNMDNLNYTETNNNDLKTSDEANQDDDYNGQADREFIDDMIESKQQNNVLEAAALNSTGTNDDVVNGLLTSSSSSGKVATDLQNNNDVELNQMNNSSVSNLNMCSKEEEYFISFNKQVDRNHDDHDNNKLKNAKEQTENDISTIEDNNDTLSFSDVTLNQNPLNKKRSKHRKYNNIEHFDQIDASSKKEHVDCSIHIVLIFIVIFVYKKRVLLSISRVIRVNHTLQRCEMPQSIDRRQRRNSTTSLQDEIDDDGENNDQDDNDNDFGRFDGGDDDDEENEQSYGPSSGTTISENGTSHSNGNENNASSAGTINENPNADNRNNLIENQRNGTSSNGGENNGSVSGNTENGSTNNTNETEQNAAASSAVANAGRVALVSSRDSNDNLWYRSVQDGIFGKYFAKYNRSNRASKKGIRVGEGDTKERNEEVKQDYTELFYMARQTYMNNLRVGHPQYQEYIERLEVMLIKWTNKDDNVLQALVPGSKKYCNGTYSFIKEFVEALVRKGEVSNSDMSVDARDCITREHGKFTNIHERGECPLSTTGAKILMLDLLRFDILHRREDDNTMWQQG